MTDAEYTAWTTHHRALFFMTSPADLELFRAWKPLVLPYDLADFIDGSNSLATENGAAFRTSHLTLIRNRITQRRLNLAAERYAAENFAATRDECLICRGAGITTVPHVEFVKEGEWIPPFPVFAMFCGSCPLGRSKYDAVLNDQDRKKLGKPAPFDWQRYVLLVPHWKELLSERAETRRKEDQAHNAASHADFTSPLKRIGRMPARPNTRTERPSEEAINKAIGIFNP